MTQLWWGLAHQWKVIFRGGRALALVGLVGLLGIMGVSALTTWAAQAYAVDAGQVDLLAVMSATWLALVLLPAVGGGGDDTEGIHAVAAGKPFRAGIHLASATSDVSVLLLVPSLALLGGLELGWAGWVAGLFLGILGVLAGQVLGAGAARLTNAVGPSVTLLTVAGLSMLAIRLSEQVGLASWVERLAISSWNYLYWAVASAALLVATVALTDRHPRSFTRSRDRALPQGAFKALVASSFFGVSRSLVARNALLTALIVPVLGQAVGLPIGAGLALLVTSSAAVMVGANAFAYDGAAPAWLLSRVEFSTVLKARYLVALCWVSLVGLGCLMAVWAVGGSLDGAYLILVAASAGAAAGLVPSVKRAQPVDLDMARAQPASPISAFGVLIRTMALVGAAFVWLPAGAILVVVYTWLAFKRAGRLGEDPVALASLS